jgi:hypothetical protein
MKGIYYETLAHDKVSVVEQVNSYADLICVPLARQLGISYYAQSPHPLIDSVVDWNTGREGYDETVRIQSQETSDQ